MKNPEAFHIQPNKEIVTKHVRISITIPAEKTKAISPSETAYHEAEHVVAASENGTDTEMVTIIPGDGYYGLTIFTHFDAVGAAAPHANGRRGTGHDMALVSMFGDMGSAISTARRILSGTREKVEAVAKALEEEKTLYSSDIREVFQKIEHPEKEEKEVFVFIHDETGQEKKKKKATMKNNMVMLPGEWIHFPKEKEA